jgi:Domain of unknown function (DUF6089)
MRSFCVLVTLVLSYTATAQNAEIGFGIGAFNYTGDLARNYHLANSKPAGTVFYRSNLSRVISFRTAVTAGKIGASDKRPIDAFSTQRKASFNLFLYEVSLATEYHFLDWRSEKRPLRFTPYVVTGLNLFGLAGVPQKTAEYSNIQPSIQLGMGIKYVINPLWYLGFEFSMRKTFFDYLDNVSEGDAANKNYRYGQPNDLDNYFFTGLSLTRTFYSIPCPGNPYK